MRPLHTAMTVANPVLLSAGALLAGTVPGAERLRLGAGCFYSAWRWL